MASDTKASLWSRSASALLHAVIANDTLRALALDFADKKLYESVIERCTLPSPLQCRHDAYRLLRNLLHSVDRALSENRISPSARQGILDVFIGQCILNEDERRAAFTTEHGFEPPGFLVISPGQRCNLRCTGCYAGRVTSSAQSLDYETLSRVVREKTELWGSHFTVLSGGEPLMYQSRGKGVMDLAAECPDNYFMFYTNGTLIDEHAAVRMAELGNLTPAISVEGMREETDARRGKGVYRQILRALACLRDAGVPFGISVTVTRHNADLALSDRFIDRYFEEEGAVYCWIFQYMPIGRSYALDLMVSPEQRVDMFERMSRLIEERDVFIVDFWNSGPATNGCLAGGRPNGYFHIDWNGTVTPCVFFPYSTDNIEEVYRRGGDLNSLLMSPLFESLRRWQREYGYLTPAPATRNQIVPCPMRDHHAVALQLIRSCGACPANSEAADALADDDYHDRLGRYGQEVASLTNAIWQDRYLDSTDSRGSDPVAHS